MHLYRLLPFVGAIIAFIGGILSFVVFAKSRKVNQRASAGISFFGCTLMIAQDVPQAFNPNFESHTYDAIMAIGAVCFLAGAVWIARRAWRDYYRSRCRIGN